jgi:ribonuclease HI
MKRLSINRGEFLAVLAGLRCLRDGLEVHGEWEEGPVVVLSDSMLLINVMTGAWIPNRMRPYHEAIVAEAVRLEAITGAPVRWVHADDEQNARAHKLVKMYARERQMQAAALWSP